ncbi:MAG: YlxM family DNA-binding protein [Lachnospiraceae bacterium]
MEKIVELTLLYDFYGELLTAKQQEVYEAVVLEDCSYSEVAENLSISRQGVHEMVKRCTAILTDYESRLHLVAKFLTIQSKIRLLKEAAVKSGHTEIEHMANEVLEEL